MAIVNSINPPDVDCPVCGTKLIEFQTYHGDQNDLVCGRIFEFWECHTFTGFCRNKKCNAMTDFVRKTVIKTEYNKKRTL
ncbi:MAG: hypothetical protein ACUZ8E_11980 [Candidatus Anammoxibacter sp.]